MSTIKNDCSDFTEENECNQNQCVWTEGKCEENIFHILQKNSSSNSFSSSSADEKCGDKEPTYRNDCFKYSTSIIL